MARRRIVITGAGAISGNGAKLNGIWSNMLAGQAPRIKVDPTTHFDPAESPESYTNRAGTLVDIACVSPLSNAELGAMVGLKGKRFEAYDRHQLFALIAAQEAMRGIPGTSFSPLRFGIAGGTGAGGLLEMSAGHMQIAAHKPLTVRANLRMLPNMHAAYVANVYGLKGPGSAHCSACAASAHALIDAARTIVCEEADMMLVVGADVSISPFGFASFIAQNALSTDSRPYRSDRQGFLMGEGAGALVLEELKHAKRRGAQIFAELAGWGSTTDGSGKTTDPDPLGGSRSASAALGMARLDAADLGCIKAHGTGTPSGDTAEAEGIRLWADGNIGTIPITAPKSYSGHLLGAAGAFEAALAVRMLEAGVVLPTHGLTAENRDEQFADCNLVMEKPTELRGNHILCNSFGFGGTNASLILSRYQ